jgi:hypothetical protein
MGKVLAWRLASMHLTVDKSLVSLGKVDRSALGVKKRNFFEVTVFILFCSSGYHF